jgi:two-component system, chemotaxis family, CheB/CheR fusion protein
MFVVAIGASAGGVAALEQLFGAMPVDTGAAFLVMTHAGAHRETVLVDILARRTRMRVTDVAQPTPLAPNHVYVIAAGAVLTHASTLTIQPSSDAPREHNPIDVFFASVARSAGENAIAVVLSGAGNDGSLGVKAIKEEGGLTIAQGSDQAGPSHESMPASAIATGLVDVILSVAEIGPKLRDYFRSFGQLKATASTTATHAEGALNDILSTLQKRVGHDFSRYKEKTLLRRVHRRMQVLQVETLPDYAERIRQEGEEAGLLFRDLLIGVTSFFRDADAFDALSKRVIPKLFENTGAADTVRVWVPGCSTGEEAYSVAILMREHMATLPAAPRVQVFATDIDEPALAAARSARYPRAMLEHVSPERIRRYFRTEGASYVLSKDVRDLCVFSAHSVIRDPPFSRMDLVSCRNLLIYFNSDLQDNVLPVFNYALKPGGFLFLGPSESVSRHSDLFSALDKKQGIYQRRSIMNGNVHVPTWVSKAHAGVYHNAEAAVRKDQRLWKRVEAQILESHAPAHIVVEAEGDIVYYSARTGKYLEPQMGSPSRQLLSMVRKGLRLELRAALREAAEKQAVVTRERLELELDDRVQAVKLTVQPMPLSEAHAEPLYLVVFTDIGPPISREEAALSRPTHTGGDVGSLEQELRETRDRLQATIEEYETALEELKSGNEELVSVNEELQSTNEELETSKEELQSVNEELNTVNHELASKVEELHQSNADLRNLFESTQIATVFLDRFMVIRSFTPAVRAIFNLISADRGRPITDIAHQLDGVDLRADIRKVLDTREPLEHPVRQRDGRMFHLMRILPYRTNDDEIDGVLITFVNVTEVIAAEEQQRLLVAELNHRVRNMLQVVIGLCNQTLHRSADLKEFEAAFLGRVQALGRAYELLSREGWRRVSLEELVRSQLAGFATQDGRYSAAGPELEIRPSTALALGLVLYELATNATKYGALSVPNGHVSITWRIDDGASEAPLLVMRWVERDGPEVKTPARTGFGAELVKRQLRHELGGDATIAFNKEGLEMTITAPARDIVFLSERVRSASASA